VHTNTPEYARIFTAQTIERLFGAGRLSRGLINGLAVHARIEARMHRRLARYQERCAFALVSRPDQLAATTARLGGRAGLLRRGIDHRFFHPAKRDRAWLAAAHGVPPERLVVYAVGRLNRGKNVRLVAEAVAGLVARGVDAQLVCAGDGDLRPAILERLGPRATCPGNLDPEHVARLYACADLFAFASQVEEYANVVPEALAAGLPVLVAAESGMGRLVREGETGLILASADPGPWTEAMAALAGDPARRVRMGRAARHYAERHLPSWGDVLAEDLLPRWRQAALLAKRAG
jgi:glycosyltransferase involved in cell wall biosynthesis